MNRPLIAGAFALLFIPSIAHSAQKTEAALTLLEKPGARAAALGESFSSAVDDVTSSAYNPAALSSLESGQASFLFQRGAIEDSYGQLMVGLPRNERLSLGLSVGYYNGGDVDVFDGAKQRTVAAQRDVVVGLGSAWKVGKVSVGGMGKYFSSELAEQSKATAFAADLGLGFTYSSSLRFSAAMQNFGTELKYEAATSDLPRTLRAGAAYLFNQQALPTTLFLEAPYSVNRHTLEPGLGLEMLFGPLAVRTGYKSNEDGGEFSIGTGFLIGRAAIDYAFGLVDNLDSRHLISLSMRFGERPTAPIFVKRIEMPQEEKAPTKIKPLITTNTVKYEPAPYPQFPIQPLTGNDPASRVYIVREGDTLKSIAKARYGFEEFWQEIRNANRHLGLDPENLKPGQRILLPKKRS